MTNRFDELRELEIDYSIPIDIFSRKAKTLFNQLAKGENLKSRIDEAEYGDGGCRLYLSACGDSLGDLGLFLINFVDDITFLASENKKLMKLKLGVSHVTMNGSEINIEFDGV